MSKPSYEVVFKNAISRYGTIVDLGSMVFRNFRTDTDRFTQITEALSQQYPVVAEHEIKLLRPGDNAWTDERNPHTAIRNSEGMLIRLRYQRLGRTSLGIH